MNIIAAYQSIESIDKSSVDKILKKDFNLSPHEAITMAQLINEMKSYKADSACFNGYYVSYTINQISKEFDLLRFSDTMAVNIELKGTLDKDDKLKKITNQMHQNHYYLNFLRQEIRIFTYIESDGLYQYDLQKGNAKKIDITILIELLTKQKVNYGINPDDLFIPSNYLISPFNNPDSFIGQEYFLTDHQQRIKTEIMNDLKKGQYKIYCVSANAGTGKTLLAYDIGKSLMRIGYLPLIIHCGKLNQGHEKLINKYKWKISPIRNVNDRFFDNWNEHEVGFFIIDEAHRIHLSQLDLIINKSLELGIPLLFSYDTKQYLRNGESTDISEYIKQKYRDVPIVERSLTNKIRTNKDMASFIMNLFQIGSSNSHLNYGNITIEYFEELDDITNYINDLQNIDNWKAVTFTNSQYNIEPLDNIAGICEIKAHDVIGQEFKKVVVVLDTNFKYNEQGRLISKHNYYSATGMLFQIVTRAIDELKIVVLNNPDLFTQLLKIKHCDFTKTE